MDGAEADVLAFMTFPKPTARNPQHHPLERLNAEIKRRTDVVASSRMKPRSAPRRRAAARAERRVATAAA